MSREEELQCVISDLCGQVRERDAEIARLRSELRDITIAEIKAALTNDTIICHRKYQEPKKLKAPNFIFCAGDENALHLDAQDRGFFIVRLGDNG